MQAFDFFDVGRPGALIHRLHKHSQINHQQLASKMDKHSFQVSRNFHISIGLIIIQMLD
jgi:hypothetical protein